LAFSILGFAANISIILYGSVLSENLSEDLFGFSIVLMLVGFFPMIFKWSGARITAVITGIFLAVYFAFAALDLIKYVRGD